MQSSGTIKSGLRQRVVTAFWLVAGFLTILLLLPPLYFTGLCAFILLVAAWEWGAFAGLSAIYSRALFSIGLLLVFWLFHEISADTNHLFESLLQVAAACWFFAFVAVLRYPGAPAGWLNRTLILAIGALLLLVALYSLLFLHSRPAGQIWILYCVAIVAAADTGAYFSGKRWGKHKLAVNVSPGKTWEGVIGGMFAAQCVALLFYRFWANDVMQGVPNFILPVFLAVALVQSFASVIGDLFESLLKRRVGIKDSGVILPGHGGVLDRIDGLLASVPLFVLCFILLGW